MLFGAGATADAASITETVVLNCLVEGSPTSPCGTYALDGTMTSSGDASAFAAFQVDLVLFGVAAADNIAMPSASTTQCAVLSTAAGAATNVTGTADANFASTLVLSGFTVLDVNGNDVSSRVLFSSESGTTIQRTAC